jgi:hypothetical protein
VVRSNPEEDHGIPDHARSRGALEDDDELEPRPLGLLVLTAIVALAVGGGAGFAIGFKVEQNRIKSQAKKDDRTQPAAQQEQQPRRRQPVGEVTEMRAGSLTIRNANGRDVRINTDGSTVVETTSPGNPGSIVQGARIMVSGEGQPDGTFTAKEIVILPPNSRFVGSQ